MKLDLEAKFTNNLVNGADDITRLSKDSTADSEGVTFFDKNKTIYIANDFSDKKAIAINLQDLTDIIKNEVLIDVIEFLKDQLDSTFQDPTGTAGSPLAPLWTARSASIQVKIDEAEIELQNQKDKFKNIEDNLK